MSDDRLGWPVVTVSAACALVLGISACGGSDDGGSDAAGSTSTEPATQVDAGDTAEQQVRRTFEQLKAAFDARDARGVCSLLTPAAQRRTMGQSAGSRGKGCRDAVAPVIETYGSTLIRESTVARVRVRGDSAVAAIRAGRRGTNDFDFVRTRDGWKLDDPLAVEDL